MHLPASSGIIIAIARFRRDRRALSIVEFALMLPIMLILFLGGSETTQAVTIKRKVTIAARTVADLVAQSGEVSDAQMTSIFNATRAILTPYPTGNLQVVVASIAIDGDGDATVSWSDGSNMDALEEDESVELPEGLNIPNTTVIWARARYDFTPAVGYVMTGTIGLTDQIYLRPRLVQSVKRID